MIKKAVVLIIGGIAGYLYYYFIGCSSGSCPLTGNPFSSVLFGVVFSALFLFPEKRKK